MEIRINRIEGKIIELLVISFFQAIGTLIIINCLIGFWLFMTIGWKYLGALFATRLLDFLTANLILHSLGFLHFLVFELFLFVVIFISVFINFTDGEAWRQRRAKIRDSQHW